MKNLIKLTTTLLLFCVGFVSCNDENEETSMNNELIGWYINKTGIPNSNEFLPIEAAIKNNELLYSSKYAGDCYATRELFFYSDGSFGRHDYEAIPLPLYMAGYQYVNYLFFLCARFCTRWFFNPLFLRVLPLNLTLLSPALRPSFRQLDIVLLT